MNLGLLAAAIGPVVWGTPANFNGFRVLAALLHGTLVVGVNQTLRRWTEITTYIRQGGHHVGHWPAFLVTFRLILLFCQIFFIFWKTVAAFSNTHFDVLFASVEGYVAAKIANIDDQFEIPSFYLDISFVIQALVVITLHFSGFMRTVLYWLPLVELKWLVAFWTKGHQWVRYLTNKFNYQSSLTNNLSRVMTRVNKLLLLHANIHAILQYVPFTIL